MLKALSVCSGIGGFDLAAEMTGAIETVAFSEIEPFCCRVLAHHWPGVPNLGDMYGITAARLREVGIEPSEIDLLLAGVPCQGNSQAGKRRGRQDERNLWPETARILREIRPRWLVVENVAGLLSASTLRGDREDHGVFGDLLRDLAAMGYSAGWVVYGAADVGAPHLRERVFIVAYLADAEGSSDADVASCGRRDLALECSEFGSDDRDCVGDSSARIRYGEPATASRASDLADTEQRQLQRQRGCGDVADAPGASARSRDQRQWNGNPARDGGEDIPGDGQAVAGLARSQGRRTSGSARKHRQAEPGLGHESHGVPRGLARYSRRVGIWPSGPHEAQHDWEPPRTTTGTKDRVSKLKALGNSIVPQQAYLVLQAIVACELQEQEGAYRVR
jgi:DNA (cytosine-5)-methyltransferase 1